MYLTAQRVRSENRTGVNVLLYRHSPSLDVSALDPASIVETDPGELVSAGIAVPPGGNAVISYLDVVAAESLRTETIVERIEIFRDAAIRDGAASQDGVSVRFALLAGATMRPQPEYRELSQRMIALLIRPHLLSWESGEGVLMLCSEGEDELQFSIAPHSEVALRQTLGMHWRPPTVTITRTTLGDLRSYGFDAYEQIAMVITGYRLDELLPLGPVQFETSSGSHLWAWPARSPGVGYCLTCRRQHTLIPDGGGFRCTNCSAMQNNDGRFVAVLQY